MERVGEGEGKMERYCSTGQSPQRAVAPTEEEEEEVILHTHPPVKMEQTKCSETSAYKIQMPGELPRRKHTTIVRSACKVPDIFLRF